MFLVEIRIVPTLRGMHRDGVCRSLSILLKLKRSALIPSVTIYSCFLWIFTLYNTSGQATQSIIGPATHHRLLRALSSILRLVEG